ncbi:MarR family transcriptional regulator [Actinorhabdospora filicis]|uniref:MarR family transcriptional regulator n=1 Tax=Actinorhabdospora filicis TaxID=1785913 RepID=A0A9W6SKT0_9ACTN|nr:helix-turn-helix domain-containing protein [Actinorhabdospora filicis]GLZ78824.1 MarR family transcriptional regulator [Actinorhabdospora filicis]
MPGGRLTRHERRQIAQGLGEGLAYAEIARRLERPTSTITREVMRNGGAGGYRPELAQLATERRAHRGRRAAPVPAGGGDVAAVRVYEEMFAANFMGTGMPAMTSRVLACLALAEDGGFTAAELAARLGVSAASVSKAVTLLEGQSQLRREKAPGRRERYVVDDDVWYQAMMASARSIAALTGIAREGAGALGEGAAAARLARVARFLAVVSSGIERAAEEARELLHDDTTG